MIFPLPNTRVQGKLISPALDKHLLSLPPFGFSFTSCPPPPAAPHPRPCGRLLDCYRTLSNTCWQLPEITPERGRQAVPSGSLYFYPEHQQGQLLSKAVFDPPPHPTPPPAFWQLKNLGGGGESMFSECIWESLNRPLVPGLKAQPMSGTSMGTCGPAGGRTEVQQRH